MEYLTNEQDKLIGKLAEDAEIRGALINLIVEAGTDAVKNYKIDIKRLARSNRHKGFILGAAFATGTIYVSNHLEDIKSKFNNMVEEKL